MDALEKICDNDAEREFMTEVVVRQGLPQNKQMATAIKELERQKRILRAGLRKFMGTDYPEEIRQQALAILTEASTPPDLGIRESADSFVSPFTDKGGEGKGGEGKGEKVLLRRHSFKADPEKDAACRFTPEQIDELAEGGVDFGK